MFSRLRRTTLYAFTDLQPFLDKAVKDLGLPYRLEVKPQPKAGVYTIPPGDRVRVDETFPSIFRREEMHLTARHETAHHILYHRLGPLSARTQGDTNTEKYAHFKVLAREEEVQCDDLACLSRSDAWHHANGLQKEINHYQGESGDLEQVRERIRRLRERALPRSRWAQWVWKLWYPSAVPDDIESLPAGKR